MKKSANPNARPGDSAGGGKRPQPGQSEIEQTMELCRLQRKKLSGLLSLLRRNRP